MTVSAATFAISALLFAMPARAEYNFATSPDDCHTKVDQPGDHSDLRLPVGTSSVELWGDWMDFNDPSVDGNLIPTPSVRARHSGPWNANRGCGMIGSIVLRFRVQPDTMTHGFHATLRFSRSNALGLSVRRYPRRQILTWDAHQSARCLGDVQVLDNFKTVIIQLPAGHRADRSNCAASLNLTGLSTDDLQVDASSSYSDHFTGLPPFATPNATSLMTIYTETNAVSFALDSTAVRALTATSVSNITLAAPNDLGSNRVRLEIRPSSR